MRSLSGSTIISQSLLSSCTIDHNVKTTKLEYIVSHKRIIIVKNKESGVPM